MRREASCCCGALKAICDGEPGLISVCHCSDCQKRTGAPFGIAAFFIAETVTILGEHKIFERPSDSGFNVRFHFCPECGSTVFWEPLRKPGIIAVAVGAFAAPDFDAPSQEVYTQKRHLWVRPLGEP